MAPNYIDIMQIFMSAKAYFGANVDTWAVVRSHIDIKIHN